MTRPIVFVLGISAAGKSHVSGYIAAKYSFVHFEIDQAPHNGIDHFGLRDPWEEFLKRKNALPLAEELRRRMCDKCAGAVLSFPSNLIGCLSPEHVLALKPCVKLAVLFGPAELCRSSFARRESLSGRNYSVDLWDCNNLSLYAALEQPFLKPYLVPVFEPSGEWRPTETIATEVCGR